jgi:hypothetical protein
MRTRSAAAVAVAAIAAGGITVVAAGATGPADPSNQGGKSGSTFAAGVEACKDALTAGQHSIGDCVSDLAMHHGQTKHSEDKDKDRDDRGKAPAAPKVEDKDKDRDDHSGATTEGKSDATHGKAATNASSKSEGHETEGKSDSAHGH